MLSIDTPAPGFYLLDQDSVMRRLSDYLGSWVLLYFYPKDDTPGCTEEACMIRDSYTEFSALGVTVIGVSHDTPESHTVFREKYSLPFTLLSDPGKTVMKQYEAVQGVFTKRCSYLIDPSGNIRAIYPKVDPASHAVLVLNDLRQILTIRV
jgi:peroxiredoxin Q/BCP